MTDTCKLLIGRNGEGLISTIGVDVPIAIKSKEGRYTVYCPSFQTFGYSLTSEDDAIEDFKKSLGVFFKVHLFRETLEEALVKFGWEQCETVSSYKGAPSKFPTERAFEHQYAMVA